MPNVPYLFTGLLGDDEHAYVCVCKSCAEMHHLKTSDSCVDGYVCMVEGCQNETSLVHYVWDYRPGVQESLNKKE